MLSLDFGGDLALSFQKQVHDLDAKPETPGAVPPAEDRPAAPDLGSFMRRVFRDPADAQGGPPKVALLRRDYEMAFDLLTRASSAFQVLMARCQQLEAEIRQVKDQAWADVDAANQVKKQWQQLAATLKMHLEDSDSQLTALKQRIEASEARVAAEQEAAQAAEQHAAVAIDLTTLFHDKIVAAFGIGSPAHSALDAVATGTVHGGIIAPDK